MRALPAVVLCLSVVASAQVTDFKIYPGLKTQFDQSCTSFTSRCSLGNAAGEVLQEIPGGGRDTFGNTNDFCRGVGLGASGPGGSLTNIYYITQTDGSGGLAYNLRVREVDPVTGRGPNPLLALLNLPATLPSSGAWGVNVSLTTPLGVPAAKSWFVGLGVPPGQSLQMSIYAAGAARANAGRLDWQIDAVGVVSQCGAASGFLWDIGVSVESATLVAGAVHGVATRCLDPDWGAGGLWLDNTGHGDGLGFFVRDARSNGAAVSLFVSDRASAPTFVPGLLDGALLIGPQPLVQVSFGTSAISGGEAQVLLPVLGRGRLVGLQGMVWWQAIVAGPMLPLRMTNAAGVSLQ